MLWMDALIAHDGGDFNGLDATTTRLMTQYSENDFPLWLTGKATPLA